jgi:WD40 repeat protein
LALVNYETSQYLEVSTPSGIDTLATLEQSNLIFTGSDDGCIRLFSQELGLETAVSAHDDIVSSLQIDHVNHNLISGSWDGSIALWHFGEGRMLTPLSSFAAHSGPVYEIASQDQSPSVCCSIGHDGFIRIWDFRDSLANGHSSSNCVSIASLNQIGSACSWSTSNPYHILCGLEDGSVLFYDIRLSSSSTSSSDPLSPSPTLSFLHCHSPSSRSTASRVNKILTSSSSDGYITAMSDGSLISVFSSNSSSPSRKW